MGSWLIENWQGIVGGGSLTTIINYAVNRKSKKADLLDKVQGIYDKWIEDSDKRQEEAKELIRQYSEDLRELRKSQGVLQMQMNDLNLAYTKEVEKSQYWMQKYDDLDKKYNELMSAHKIVTKQNEHLEKLCEELKLEHDKLKEEFENYKKTK